MWKHKTDAERGFIVAKAGEILRSKADESASTMTLEMGKRINKARGEVEFSSDILFYYAETPNVSSPRKNWIPLSEKLTWKATR